MAYVDSELRSRMEEAARYIKDKSKGFKPQITVILGTGLGGLADHLDKEYVIPYSDIPHFPVSTVESHAGNLVLGKVGGKKVAVLQGRFHYYEGWPLEKIVFPLRVTWSLGSRILIVSNAAGGLNRHFKRGDVMVIEDHIGLASLAGLNPLVGPNDEKLGPRFPDMYNAYDKELRELAKDIAIKNGIDLKEGVYIWVAGPNLETPAEYRFFQVIGADAVGMSTVPEVITARHLGMKVVGFSVITDMCIPDTVTPVNFKEILAAAEKAEAKLTKLILELIKAI